MDVASRKHAVGAEREESLERSLRLWDARLIRYEAERFDFAGRILEAARRLRPRVRSLETIHEDLRDDDAYALSKELCRATREDDFAATVRRFVVESLAPRTGLEAPLAVQRFLNVRVMLPDRPQGVFPFHTGLLYGHGPASRSVWLPLTDVRAPESWSASLQIVDLASSRRLVETAQRARMGIDEMATLFGERSRPVSAGPGDALLFTQEHVHGNVVNRTGRTRVSIDFRVAEARFGDLLARKVPGGYFELIEDGEKSSVPADNGRRNLVYLNNGTVHTAGVPVHLQRLAVHEYCGTTGTRVHFEYFELEGMEHLPTLVHAVESLECNVILYSVYALPADASFRARILDRALERGLALHFVNEALVVHDRPTRDRLDRLLRFARFGAPPGA